MEEEDEEDNYMDIDIDNNEEMMDVVSILRSFIDDDDGGNWVPITNIDPWAGSWTPPPFGPGPRITAETIFF